jgi:3-keto-5-aminohexanoate cleavage enzyme
MYIQGEKSGKLIIQLAPTGVIPTKSMTPHVPVTPNEIVHDTSIAYQLGASIVHIHARDVEGKPTSDINVFAEIFSRIKEECPEMLICATTSGRFCPEVENRAKVLELKPDMATLSLGTVNFFDRPSVNTTETIKFLAERMNKYSIKPELEIFEPGFINTAKYFIKKGILKPPLHFNLLLGSLGSISADIRDLVYLVESLPSGNSWMGAGIGRFQTQIIVASILMGGHVRVGIEDALYYDVAQTKLATNEALVKRIVRIAGELGREIATPEEARVILGIR